MNHTCPTAFVWNRQYICQHIPTIVIKQAGRSLDDEAAVRSAAAAADWQIAAGHSLPQPRIAPLGSALASPPVAPSSASSPAATLRIIASARPVPGAQGAAPAGAARAAAAPPHLQSRSAPAAAVAGGSGSVRPVAARAGSPDKRAGQPPSASPTSSVSQLHSGRCTSTAQAGAHLSLRLNAVPINCEVTCLAPITRSALGLHRSEAESSDDEGLGVVEPTARPPLQHAQTVGIPQQRRKLTAGVISLSGEG